MSVRVLMMAHRKAGTTTAQFQQYYEEKHIPLMKSLSGNLWPMEHKRTYIVRKDDDAAAGNPAAELFGASDDFPFDAIAEMTFEDMDHFQRFLARTMEEDFKAQREADEENFLDIGSLKVVLLGDTCSTKR